MQSIAQPRGACGLKAAESRAFANRVTRARVGARRPSLAVFAKKSVVAVAAPEKPTVLVAEKLGSAGLEVLEQYATVDASYNLTPEQLLEKIGQSDALIVRSATKVTRAVFEAANGRLKVVGRAGVGVDNVDLAAATEYGCLVVNAPTANTVAAAEHGIALLCALSRNVAQADSSMKTGKWDRNKYVGVSLVGKTLAVLGFGKVGSEVGRRAKGLGMTVIAYDPYASEEKARALGVELVDFDQALARGDFFSLHMPLTPSTKNLLNDETFAKMKKGAYIINVARGGVIDDAALGRAIDNKIVAGAALDVFTEEPPKFADHPLINRPEVVCTPHLGASTVEAQEGVSVEVVEAVVDALAGKLSATAVNAPLVPAEILAELQPYVTLAEGLGKAAVQLVGPKGFTDINITYRSPRGDDLDTRLLRAMIYKGILEQTTTAKVNLVNADLLAKSRGLRVTEVTLQSDGRDVLSSLTVSLGASSTKFSAALDQAGRISVEGAVIGGNPFITKIGTFDTELSLDGSIVLCRQRDQPGIVGAVGMVLAKDNVNISLMTISRTGKNQDAIMAIGVDEEPSEQALSEIVGVKGISEVCVFTEK